MKKITCIIILVSFLNSTAVCGSVKSFQEVKKGNHTKPPFTDSAVILIPFDYKQSALYHAYTFEVIDSVVNILLKDSSITLSINGYAHPDEGNDTICKYLSLNRALFVRDYILGRGVQPFRIIFVRGMGKRQSKKSNVNKDGHALNCRAELVMNLPPPPTPTKIEDRDEDGIADADDTCADAFGYKENNGCPDKDAIIIPFETQQSWLSPSTYKMLDSVVAMLRENPAVKFSVQGHAYPTEGITSFCEKLATERAEVVKKYLLSRNISGERIVAIKSFGINHPYNAGKNPEDIAKNSRAQIMLEK